MSRITVVLSDATRIGCELLTRGVERSAAELQVVEAVTSVQEFVDSVRTRRPDVGLLSVNLQDGALAGFGALREIISQSLPTRVVMLFDKCERDFIVAAFRGGAKGVFFRDKSIELLRKCIRCVHEGQIWAGATELIFLLEALTAASPLGSTTMRSAEPLTSREQQIVELVAQGMSNREVAQQLHLSEHTIKNYLFRIYDKLGVSGRVELAVYAVNHNAAA